jgi:hypothetical protein
MSNQQTYRQLVGDAILGVDTLWGGDVMCPSGTGRFIADSWFSDEPLPRAYTHEAAATVRGFGGVTAQQPDVEALNRYLGEVDIPGAIEGLRQAARTPSAEMPRLRARYLENLSECLTAMWDLAMETLGRGEPVPYERSVAASTGLPPSPSRPEEKRRQVQELLRVSGSGSNGDGDALLSAVDEWRRVRLTPMASVRPLGAAVIAYFDRLCEANLLPYLPEEMRAVPRANIEFMAIREAWFSGSMNYLGRARDQKGAPLYEATYEINASLEISFPEFQQLVSHEVVPGHVTTFAYLQNQFVRGAVDFEASVLTMNTRGAALFEGIANNAVLIAHGVTASEQLADEDLRIGLLLALLQDDAKNQASYLTYKEHLPQQEVAATLRRDFLVSEERAGKLSGAWARHPLLGRMYLPAYRAGTEKVAELRRQHPARRLLPVLYGTEGLVDITTIDDALDQRAGEE